MADGVNQNGTVFGSGLGRDELFILSSSLISWFFKLSLCLYLCFRFSGLFLTQNEMRWIKIQKTLFDFVIYNLYMFCNTQDMYAKTMHGNHKIFQNFLISDLTVKIGCFYFKDFLHTLLDMTRIFIANIQCKYWYIHFQM